MQKPGMVIGEKGVKYGLHVRQPKQEEQKKKPSGRLAAFSADSDSDEDVGAQVARQAARKVADTKVQEMYAAALAEDPSAFDYDGVYDSIQEQKAAPKLQDKVTRQPKYIASLLEQAQLRKKEQDISNERRLLKERQKEDHMYDNEEKFITSAYRKKLEEDKKWQESQRLKELDDEQNDATKLGHMNNFFHNLTRNVALGGAAKQPQQSKHQIAGGAATVADDDGVTAQPSTSEAAAANRSHEEEQQQQRSQQSPASLELEAAGNRDQDTQQPQQQRQSDSNADDSDKAQHLRQAAAGAGAGRRPKEAVDHQSRSPEHTPEQEVTVGGKRKNDDSAVAAARDRYLARKRQQQMAP